VPDPGKSSRRLQAVRRRAWRAGGEAQTEEEARAYLQARLAVFSKLVFWSFTALLVFLFVMYAKYPHVQPQNQPIIYGVATSALAILAIVWRVILVRRSLSVEALYWIDVIITIGSGTCFAAVATLAYDLQASSYTCLLFVSFTIFTRALIVPSSAKRTAITSSLGFIPILAGAVVVSQLGKFEVPPPAFVAGGLLYNGVAVALATVGSQIIYGLNKKLSEAMQLGQYTLGRKIGEGGMGAVYHAHHALLRRPTAVKLMLPNLGADALDRFEREVQAMSRLTHPNTVAVFDYGRNPDGALYYAMEYLGGIDLENLVRLHGAQPANRVVDILVQVCGALQEAHDANLIHRDIKPPNILLCERGGLPDIAKVVDFGLVKEITRDTTASTQVILGTPHYIAPEIVTDPNMISPAVDLYALGAVGYYLLTGKRVFEAKTAVEILVLHRTHAPTPPSELGIHIAPDLEKIILKCLSKDPKDRYATARELAEALEAVPRSRDWDRDEARRWWREFRARAVEPVTSDSETMTITIDLEHRT
jgi:serine/threonine-protein kinase